MTQPARPRIVWLLAGEASGDILGARLMEALSQLDHNMMFVGVGGAQMEALGLHSLFPMQDLSIMGLAEILPRIRKLSARLDEAVNDITLRKPDVIVTIDSPGFALRLLKRIKHLGIPRLHYVGPQVWAWRESRAKSFPQLWDRLLCLLPFEQGWFQQRGIPATFVGHPVIQSGADTGDGAHFRRRHGIADHVPIIVLLPGSRKSEVPRLLPIYGRMVAILKARFGEICPVIPISPLMQGVVRHATAKWAEPPRIIVDMHDKFDAFAAAGVAMTKSGTSTLELALAGTPMVVAYRVHALTAYFARRMIKVPFVAMVNLLAGREIVPELLQEKCTPENLASAVTQLLTDPDARAAQKTAFTEIMSQLHAPDRDGAPVTPAEAAAYEVMALLQPSENVSP
ncbi:lipid-A-disaccharide synthase [Candidatus Kirkpatrickella diaphorinae]|uniref:Lipid-A-disaccharide synthase n=1 Tax=Candidatus Kirkpatrickella diaphorinae TaxID=2984322 RepID=A0ABY6GKN6_9PROT|nr:lipid-A-disaccharide synthase [Candidatus Kirkpatrickella diaphorinae]UYH51576.1 lipid-A-disaccharide synthase [Candidatus Kirkpatrickella diaphorinae]